MENYTKSKYADFYLYTEDIGDTFILRLIRETGAFAEDVCEWLLENIQPGWICYDVGANIGQMSMLMAIATKSNGAVYAFEPQKRLVEAFNYGKQLSQLVDTAEIYMYPIGLSNNKASLDLKINPTNIGGATLSPEVIAPIRKIKHNYIYDTVDVDRLDSLNLPSPDFIKIDIEGHEAKAWSGFTQDAKECPIILAEVGIYTQAWLLSEYLKYDRKAYTLSGERLPDTALDLLEYLHTLEFKQTDIIFRR